MPASRKRKNRGKGVGARERRRRIHQSNDAARDRLLADRVMGAAFTNSALALLLGIQQARGSK